MRIQILEGSNFYLLQGTAVGATKQGDIAVVLDILPQVAMVFRPHEVIRASVRL